MIVPTSPTAIHRALSKFLKIGMEEIDARTSIAFAFVLNSVEQGLHKSKIFLYRGVFKHFV